VAPNSLNKFQTADIFACQPGTAAVPSVCQMFVFFVSQHCYCRESSLYGLYRLLEMFISKGGYILFRNATSASSPPLSPSGEANAVIKP